MPGGERPTKSWGHRIREIRGDRGQVEIAEAAGISQPQLSRIENGYIEAFDPAVIARLAVALGVDPDAIWDWPLPEAASQ